VDASADHVMMIVPNTTLPVASSGPYPRQELALPRMQADHIYVVNGQVMDCEQLVTILDSLRAQLAGDGLALAPLDGLR
jgi:hypothetical protein